MASTAPRASQAPCKSTGRFRPMARLRFMPKVGPGLKNMFPDGAHREALSTATTSTRTSKVRREPAPAPRADRARSSSRSNNHEIPDKWLLVDKYAVHGDDSAFEEPRRFCHPSLSMRELKICENYFF